MSFYKEGIEKTPIVGDMKIKPIGEMLQDKIHKLETENFELTKQNEKLLKAYKEDEEVIHLMQAEFERLENIEDNTDMLKIELKEANAVIEEMAKMINNAYYEEDLFWRWFEKNINPIPNCLSDRIINIKEYFRNKARRIKNNEF